MGYWTEFHFNVELDSRLQEEVLAVLKYMLNPTWETQDTITLPKHDFFLADRWESLLVGNSYMFPAITHSRLSWDDIGDCYYLSIRSSIKNYDKEIELFVDWVTPYLSHNNGNFLGFMRNEDSENPRLIYYPNTYYQVIREEIIRGE